MVSALFRGKTTSFSDECIYTVSGFPALCRLHDRCNPKAALIRGGFLCCLWPRASLISPKTTSLAHQSNHLSSMSLKRTQLLPLSPIHDLDLNLDTRTSRSQPDLFTTEEHWKVLLLTPTLACVFTPLQYLFSYKTVGQNSCNGFWEEQF